MWLCGAYATIANGGMYIEPTLYAKIEDAEGNLFYEKKQETHRVIRETTAWMLTDMMKDVVKYYGTSPVCNFDEEMAIAGKSGTTDDSNDYAFVGYTPYYTCCIQAGFDYVAYPEIYYESLGTTSLNPDGSISTYDDYGDEWIYWNGHKELWAAVMSKIHENLPKITDFGEPPEGITEVSLCRDSGLLAGPYCSQDPRGNRITYDWIHVEDIPTRVCPNHIQLSVCAETGRIATKYCPTTETRVFMTRTDDEISDISASGLTRISDFKYAAYPYKYADSIIGSDAYKTMMGDTNYSTPLVDDIASYEPVWCGECQKHLHKAPEESSDVVPLESSAVPTATLNDQQPPSAFGRGLNDEETSWTMDALPMEERIKTPYVSLTKNTRKKSKDK